MREAIIGFAGVVVGALVAGGFEFGFRRRSEKATVKAASRLLQQQLFTAEETISTRSNAIWREGWPPDSGENYDFAEVFAMWRETQGTLAEHLSGDEWEAVTAAMEFIPVFDGTVPGQVPTSRRGSRSADEEEELQKGLVELLQNRLEQATVALERTAFGWKRARRVRRELAIARLEDEQDIESP